MCGEYCLESPQAGPLSTSTQSRLPRQQTLRARAGSRPTSARPSIDRQHQAGKPSCTRPAPANPGGACTSVSYCQTVPGTGTRLLMASQVTRIQKSTATRMSPSGPGCVISRLLQWFAPIKPFRRSQAPHGHLFLAPINSEGNIGSSDEMKSSL
jgi:hypothetical protein